jgi:hypothetical protein
MGQPAGPLVQFGVRNLPVAAGHRDALAEGVRRVLEEVGEVQGHGTKVERVTVLGKPLMRGNRGDRG